MNKPPIRPIRVDYKCDKCNVGYMRPNGKMIHAIYTSQYRVEFVHICTHCGVDQKFTEKYPTVRYAREGELLDLNNYTPQQL